MGEKNFGCHRFFLGVATEMYGGVRIDSNVGIVRIDGVTVMSIMTEVSGMAD